jgi:hypothetical protein
MVKMTQDREVLKENIELIQKELEEDETQE